MNLISPLATQAKQQERIEICLQCPSLVEKDKCKECGCYIAYKVWLNKSTCPLNKWK